MIETKLIETGVDLTDPNDIYSPNKIDIVKSILEQRYVNRCFQGMKILSIEKIVRISDAVIDNAVSHVRFLLSVSLIVKGIIFHHDEVIHGCIIKDVNQFMITASTEHCSMKIESNPVSENIYKILQTNMKIPVIIQQTKYSIGKSEITAIAIPYAPEPYRHVIWITNGHLEQHDITKLKDIYDKINDELEIHKKIISNPGYNIFKSIIYPYKSDQKYELSQEVGLYKLKSFTFIKDNKIHIDDNFLPVAIVCNPADNILNARIWYNDEEFKTVKSSNVVTSTLFTALYTIYFRYLSQLILLRGFVETYPTPKDASDIQAYLRLCRQAQK